MKFSSVKALTMRMPCAVSCSDSIICIAPWNSLAMILRTRMPILRTPTAASGTNISARSDSSGSCDTMTMTSPTIVNAVAGERGDEEVEDVARRLGDERLAGDEFGRMRAAVIADLHPQHLVEDALLDVGDDAVADPRQDDLLAIGRKALDRVNGHDRRRDFPHGLEVAADEDLVDDLADDPRRQRGGEGDQAHHREGEDIALPVLGALIESGAGAGVAFEGELRRERRRSRASRQTNNASVPRARRSSTRVRKSPPANPARAPRLPYHRRRNYGNRRLVATITPSFRRLWLAEPRRDTCA